MLERRRPVEAADSQRFALELANLGVSVRLTMAWQGRDHWLLVRLDQPKQADGSDPASPVYHHIGGSLFAVNSDSWKQGSDAT